MCAENTKPSSVIVREEEEKFFSLTSGLSLQSSHHGPAVLLYQRTGKIVKKRHANGNGFPAEVRKAAIREWDFRKQKTTIKEQGIFCLFFS